MNILNVIQARRLVDKSKGRDDADSLLIRDLWMAPGSQGFFAFRRGQQFAVMCPAGCHCTCPLALMETVDRALIMASGSRCHMTTPFIPETLQVPSCPCDSSQSAIDRAGPVGVPTSSAAGLS